VALRTTCIKNVKFKIIKIRTSCQYEGFFYYSENLNWAAQNLRLGRGLDTADLNLSCSLLEYAGYCRRYKVTPVSSEISELLLFFSYFASESKGMKFGNYFFDVCCVN